MLRNRQILLGVTGSIAAYKAADLVRRLKDEGAAVHVVMTEAACRFITPCTFEAITGNPAHVELFENPFSHINLTKEADLFLIAPATANTINKLSLGLADNLLSNLWLTHEGPSLIAPAMNSRMYRNPRVTKHIKKMKKDGVLFVGPVSGSLACGEDGIGRMAEVSSIVEASKSALTDKDLSGCKIIVTAGPTVEPIDPVRYISNRSSGKMGFAIARSAVRRGAEVTLISGPTRLYPPDEAAFIPVERASEMEAAVFKHLPRADAVIMCAAVSDFSPSKKADVKHSKGSISSIELKKNTDIIGKAGKDKGKRILIGFAAETGQGIDSAKMKLKAKNLDFIVLNDVSQKGAGFGADTNIVTIIDKMGESVEYPLMDKIDVANVILDKMIQIKS